MGEAVTIGLKIRGQEGSHCAKFVLKLIEKTGKEYTNVHWRDNLLTQYYQCLAGNQIYFQGVSKIVQIGVQISSPRPFFRHGEFSIENDLFKVKTDYNRNLL
jgi:hypothetical protein